MVKVTKFVAQNMQDLDCLDGNPNSNGEMEKRLHQSIIVGLAVYEIHGI